MNVITLYTKDSIQEKVAIEITETLNKHEDIKLRNGIF